MPKFRTRKSARTTYIYRDTSGSVIATLIPGVDGVTEADIALLHRMDDEAINADKRDSYHGLLHLDDAGNEENSPAVLEKDLADNSMSPGNLLFAAIDDAERTSAFSSVWDGLQPHQRELVKRKIQGATNRQIAAEEGVHESSIHRRLETIKKKFEDFLK
jgi:DNA-binding CsgD family transcriptional regulator